MLQFSGCMSKMGSLMMSHQKNRELTQKAKFYDIKDNSNGQPCTVKDQGDRSLKGAGRRPLQFLQFCLCHVLLQKLSNNREGIINYFKICKTTI